jgi:hypothetical protein
VAKGAGAPGFEGLSLGTKRIEEVETNTMGGSPRAEDDGSGRYSEVNRRRRLGPAQVQRRRAGAATARLGNEAASRKVRAPFIGRESLGGGAVQAGHGGGLWPVAGWAPPGQAAGPARVAQAGAGRAHGLGPGR